MWQHLQWTAMPHTTPACLFIRSIKSIWMLHAHQMNTHNEFTTNWKLQCRSHVVWLRTTVDLYRLQQSTVVLDWRTANYKRNSPFNIFNCSLCILSLSARAYARPSCNRPNSGYCGLARRSLDHQPSDWLRDRIQLQLVDSIITSYNVSVCCVVRSSNTLC